MSVTSCILPCITSNIYYSHLSLNKWDHIIHSESHFIRSTWYSLRFPRTIISIFSFLLWRISREFPWGTMVEIRTRLVEAVSNICILWGSHCIFLSNWEGKRKYLKNCTTYFINFQIYIIAENFEIISYDAKVQL